MTLAVRLLRGLSGVMALGLAVGACLALAGVILFFVTIGDLPSVPEPLRRIIETPPTEIYAANGERVLQIGGRDYVPLDQISIVFLQAVLATEDHRFWDHHGMDKLRTLKALWITLFTGRTQGASTITQQLAKNLFFSFEQTYNRKFKELLVSLQIESQFSKPEILEAYVNQIYFGPRAQGASSAARQFFGKNAAQLDLAESALLAGLLKSPTRYNPLRHLERAKSRQKVVLGRMVAVGYITAAEAAAAAEAPLEFRRQAYEGPVGGYFVDYVLKQLEERYGTEVVYHGGLKVTTTLDTHLQRLAQASVTRGLEDLDKIMAPVRSTEGGNGERPQGALVALQVNSGAIKAMVGGRRYAESEFNRAVESNRMPGSAFKPFLYYTALDQLGISPATVLVDEPVRIPVAGAPDWRPRNFGREYQGPVILKKAFTESINTVAAQLVARTGPAAVIATARRCGIVSPLNPVYSIALGTSGVSPLEMASAYSTFASQGIHYAPFAVWRVEDAYGQVLEEHIVSGSTALESRLVYQMVDMMQGVLNEGSGSVIRRLGFDKPAAGKTGTTNDYRDAWFAGFTPTLSAAVWVGFDRQEVLKDAHGVGITGGRGAAPIWAQFMIKASEGEPPRPFLHPSGIRLQAVDPVTGEPVPEDTHGAVWVAIKE
ncbi:MAG: PBP1A family penicillin-binding protein [Desulfatitalea sp.]|nr:PBP1A family penicillin-binding protein [Desulfatitalea sp.]